MHNFETLRFAIRLCADSEITLIALPSSDLLSWMFGDVNNLVVTMKKTDLAAGNFDALKVQVSN